MTVDSTFVPKLRRDLLRSDFGHEALIWSPIRQDPVALDPVARVMLDIVDGIATIGDLAEDVQAVVGIPLERAHEQVQRIVTLIDRAGALMTSDAHSVPEQRRELFVNPPSR